MLGLAAWWLESARLADAAIVLFGLALAAGVVDGIRTGAIQGKWEQYGRVTQPGRFWFHALMYGVLGAALLISAVVRFVASAGD